MERAIYQADLDKTLALLKNFLDKYSPTGAMQWLNDRVKNAVEINSAANYFMTFSAIPRYFGKHIIELSADELQQAARIRQFWHPQGWSLTQLARSYLIIELTTQKPEHFIETLNKLFMNADIYELIDLYRALPVFAHPEKFLLHATNGIRSNMISVFEAIALNNPYPADYFNENAWNQLILKSLFLDSPIQQIIGLKRRANSTLAKALINTAHERFAANRSIKLELWYLVGISTNEEVWSLLKELTEENSPILQHGALLACDHCHVAEAKELLSQHTRKKEIQNDLLKMRLFAEQIV